MAERARSYEYIEDADFDSEFPSCPTPYLKAVPTIEEQQQPETENNSFQTNDLTYLFPNTEELLEAETESEPPQTEVILQKGVAQDVTTPSETNTPDIRNQFRERWKAEVRKNPRFQESVEETAHTTEKKDRNEVMLYKKAKRGEPRPVTRGQLEDKLAAIGEIYPETTPHMLRLALSIVKDVQKAEDIVHDAYFTIAESETPFSEINHSYILKTTVNKALDAMRRKKWTVPNSEQTDELFESLEGNEMSLEETIETKDKVEATKHVLDEVVAETRDSDMTGRIFDEYYNGSTYPEISKKLNVELSMVKSTMHRLKSKVKERMAAYD